MRTLTLTPAYGRDYRSQKEVFEAWTANKDFEIATPGEFRYINREDAERYVSAGSTSCNEIFIRYQNLTKKMILVREDGGWA